MGLGLSKEKSPKTLHESLKFYTVLGRSLIFIGVLLVIIGIIVMFGAKIPYLGKLPGDIYFKKDNVTIYFPLTTSIILSIILSFIIYLITRR